MSMPASLEYYTADEVAETVSVPLSGSAYKELWAITEKANNPRPLGGDGSNGTCEYPDILTTTKYDNCMKRCWNDLSAAAQQEIIEACAKDGI